MSAPHTAALRKLASQLDDYAQEHPHLQPFAVLTEAKDEDRILSREAAAIWDEIAKSRPDDPLAWHHLAIIHHGRAYQNYDDLVRTHAQNFGDWSRAFHCWTKLVRHNAFWTYLKEQWELRSQQKGEMLAQRLIKIDLDEFRRQLPPHLIKVHETIIQDTWEKNASIARDHLQLILSSEMDVDLISRTRASLYSRKAGDVADQLTKFEFAKVRSAIEAYLHLDPTYIQALADRWSGTVAEKDRLGTFTQATARFRADETWAEKLKPLTKPGAKVTQMEAFTASAALCDFYFHHGLVLTNEANDVAKTNMTACVKHLIDATTVFGHAHDYERGGQKSVGQYEEAAMYAILLGVREEYDIAALTRVSEAYVRRFGSSAAAHATSAMVHFAKDDIDSCKKAIATAVQLNQKAPTDLGAKAISSAEQLALQGSPKVTRCMKEGQEVLQHNPTRARDLFETALGYLKMPSESKRDALFFLAAAEMRCGASYKDSAKRHLREAERMLGAFPSAQLAEVITSLLHML